VSRLLHRHAAILKLRSSIDGGVHREKELPSMYIGIGTLLLIIILIIIFT
jgi:hypothetical protein